MENTLTKHPSGFITGFLYPFRAFRFIRKNPRLYRYVLIPFFINLIIFSLVVYFGLHFFQEILTHHIPQGDAWYWFTLYYLLWLVALLLTTVIVFFLFTAIGNLIASPFNDILSEKTEEILTGESIGEPFSMSIFLQDAKRVLILECKKISLFLIVMALIVMLNLVPVVGSVLYSVLSILWTIFFLVVEYTSYVFSRKRLPFKEQRKVIYNTKLLMFGFGAGVLSILAIPFLQLLCIPLGVVGATKILYDTGNITQSQKEETHAENLRPPAAK